MIVSSSFAKSGWEGIRTWFGDAYNPWETQYTAVYDVVKSRKRSEESVSSNSFGQAVKKAEGQPISYDERRQGFVSRLTPDVWALGFNVSKEAISDDLYNIVGKKGSQQLAFSMRGTKEANGALLLDRAFTAAYAGADGKELCATDHVRISGGDSYKNELSVAANISEASMEQMLIDIMQTNNDRGFPIQLKAQSLHIVPNMIFNVKRILGSSLRAGGADNDLNALKTMGYFKSVHVNQYRSSTTSWFVKTDCPDGMLLIQRWPLELAEDNDFDTNNLKYKAEERYVFGWNDPLSFWGTPGV